MKQKLNPRKYVNTSKSINLGGLTLMENEFFVGWGTLSLINAGLAQAKNRSGLNWFFLSLFLGPIATLIIVVSDKLPDNQH
jgi:hypothetical protein